MPTILTPSTSQTSSPSLRNASLFQPSLPQSSQKYLLQRVKELEEQLEFKRIQLFESEEAREGLETRLQEHTEIDESTELDESLNDESPQPSAPEPHDCYKTGMASLVNGLLSIEEGSACSCDTATLVEQDGSDIILLHKHCRDSTNELIIKQRQDLEDLEQAARTEVRLLKFEHRAEKKQMRKDHEAENEAEKLEFERMLNAHKDKTAAVEKDHTNTIAEMREQHAAELNQVHLDSEKRVNELLEKMDNIRNSSTQLYHHLSTLCTNVTPIIQLFNNSSQLSSFSA